MIHPYHKYVVFILFIHVQRKIFDEVCGQTDVSTLTPVKNVPRVCNFSNFQKLREFDCLYVDKTLFAHQIIKNPYNVYYLSRPRMFGKTLFVSTLECILQGRKDLFNGLYIYDNYNWTSTNSVLRLDFSELDTASAKAFEMSFVNKFIDIAEGQFGTEFKPTCNDERLTLCRNFIRFIYSVKRVQPEKKLSLLIDEYDYPVTKHLDNITKANEIQSILQEFLTCLKASVGENKNIFLIYITGVIKFPRANLFSGSSKVLDISRMEEFNNICGFTYEEINTTMTGLLQASIKKTKGANHAVTDEDVEELLKKMTDSCDGHRFAQRGQALFSPSAIASYFIENSHE